MTKRLGIAFTIWFVLAVGLAMSACKRQELASGDADPVGEYALVSVNGNPVPPSISHDGVNLQVLSGSFIINADGTCSSKTVFVPPSGPEIRREGSAKYTADGPTLTMQWEGAGETVGTVQGDTFTMDNEGMVLVYKK